jgi:hypothetical protein
MVCTLHSILKTGLIFATADTAEHIGYAHGVSVGKIRDSAMPLLVV